VERLDNLSKTRVYNIPTKSKVKSLEIEINYFIKIKRIHGYILKEVKSRASDSQTEINLWQC
jgi:hypothetical protein